MHHLIVDLAEPPRARWHLDKAHRRAVTELLGIYKRDLGLSSSDNGFVTSVGAAFLPTHQLEELRGIADATGLAVDDVVLGNLYYDAIKTVWGCTAFAVPTTSGPLHARNLDWWTTDDALAAHTLVTRFINGPRGPFITVGWPGFVGALSGVAPGRFSVSLNAVSSDDPGELALPVVSLLREVLEHAVDFDEAVDRIATTTIASDAIVMVVGTRNEDRVVVERTPTRHALRFAEDDLLRASNDYRLLRVEDVGGSNPLQLSSCARFDRVGELTAAGAVVDASTALAVLGDARVRLGITVQQMVFQAANADGLLAIAPRP